MAAQAGKSRPIIFDGESVRAILDGTKTQTRRVVKPQPPDRWTRHEMTATGARWAYQIPSFDWHDARCLYGAPGDELWVRETFQFEEYGLSHADTPEGPSRIEDGIALIPRYRATAPETVLEVVPNDTGDPDEGMRWRSPIHMPRWASRLALRVTDVRVERLKEITEADAIAEGVTRRESGWSADWSRVGELSRYATASAVKGRDLAPLSERDVSLGTARHAFGNRWDRINARRGFSWESNPWVWAVTFERVEASAQ